MFRPSFYVQCLLWQRPSMAQPEQPQEETAYDRFRALPARDRRIVEEYIDFLTQKLSRQGPSKQQKKADQKKQ